MRDAAATVALRTDEVPRHAVRLVVTDRRRGAVSIAPFATLASHLRAGDVIVVNDAATLPGSLRGATVRGEELELRLSAPIEADRLVGVLFGAGDHRTRTEHRPPPPRIALGDRIRLGTSLARVVRIDGRRVEVAVDAPWQLVYGNGAPIQYAHRTERLPLYAVQTAYAARPWAAEMPSAGRPVTWDVLLGLRRAGIAVASLTHAAGLSSTGDELLDHALPWPERYEIPRTTVDAISTARARGGRVIAIGTTVVRALESAAQAGEIIAGGGIARLRIDASHTLRVVDGLVSGLHVPGESHFDLLSAFAPREHLARALDIATAHGLSSHELGDACLLV